MLSALPRVGPGLGLGLSAPRVVLLPPLVLGFLLLPGTVLRGKASAVLSQTAWAGLARAPPAGGDNQVWSVLDDATGAPDAAGARCGIGGSKTSDVIYFTNFESLSLAGWGDSGGDRGQRYADDESRYGGARSRLARGPEQHRRLSVAA